MTVGEGDGAELELGVPGEWQAGECFMVTLETERAGESYAEDVICSTRR